MSWQSKATQGCNAYSRAGLPCLCHMGEIPPSLLEVMSQCLRAAAQRSVSVQPQLAQKVKLKTSSIQSLGEFCCISHSLWNKLLENNVPLSPLPNPTVLQLLPQFSPSPVTGMILERMHLSVDILQQQKMRRPGVMYITSLKFTSQGP